jgi:hypothetical protein
MKKTAVLLAGLLLVTGTVFAEGWELTGADVSGTFNLIDTETGMNMDAGDNALSFEMTKEGDFGSVSFGADFDEGDDAGTGIDVTYSKTEGDFSVGLGATIDFAEDNDVDGSDTGVAFSTDGDSDTYLAWNVMGSEEMTLTVYPFEVDGMSWDNDTFESFAALSYTADATTGELTTSGTGLPGFAFAMDLAEDTTVTAKLAIKDGDTTTKNVTVLKGEVSTKVSGVSLDAFVGIVGEDSDANQEAVTAMAAKASMTMDALTLAGEFNTETYSDEDAAVGIYAKASLAMDEMNGYTPTAYASFKNLNEMAVAVDEGDMSNSYGESYTEIEAGVKLAQGSFYVTPKIVMYSSDADGFTEEDETSVTNSAVELGVTFGYSM